MAEENIYTLLVNKKRISVSREVYRAYYQLKERETYLDKLSKKHNISFEECEEKGIQVDYLLSHTEESIEDNIIKRDLLRKLALCMKMLSEQERLLIYALYFNNKTETMLAAEWKINQSSISRRKAKILSKLKKILEI